ncbi:dihydroxyacetone kinase phosphoryl donor subunit DhaM, partial [Mobiluncus sp.]|uniref:dihydroxyacetone kinase phosphoryl donor subunit DhaM n=1 Tax=Mobiluncus sp. TaxID=47293 RepID=UPI002A90BFB9
MSVGLVVVSHSRPLAEAAVELALIMVHGDRPPIEIAAGTDDGGFGTDAVAVMEAIMSANDGDGVVVFVDLGSAITSTDMAVEMLADKGEEIDVRVLSAPFVEGLNAAVVLAAAGAGIDAIVGEANGSLAPKLELVGGDGEVGDGAAAGDLGAGADAAIGGAGPDSTENATADWDAADSTVVINKVGLHARPAATIAEVAGGFAEAEVVLEKAGRQVNAKSPVEIATLSASAGDTVWVRARGEGAAEVVEAIVALIDSGFGEELAPGVAGVGAGAGAVPGAAGAPGGADGVNTQIAGLGSTAADGGGSGSSSQPDRGQAGPRHLGVSPGRAVGVVRKLAPVAVKPDAVTIQASAVEDEVARLDAALSKTAAAYKQQAAAASGQVREILNATAAFAADPTLRSGAERRVRKQLADAASAVWESAGEMAAQLRAAGGLFAERVSDVEDVRNRVVARL